MEALISQFTFLSDQALQDKDFDSSTIEEDLKLFEIETYKAWACVELDQEKEVEETEVSMQQAEDYFDLVMDEFWHFEEGMSNAEVDGLDETAESGRKLGNLMEKAASVASMRYIEAAVKSAWKGLSSSGKVHSN
ncbi:hypothetical protein SESBI_41049 [Sesbania bispinosa]|nr:hypothetical protein SESBI_41049 [Sesbania bispinosa]